MDIVNRLAEPRYSQLDDLLAFVSIYDDKARTEAYLQMLARHEDLIRGRVVLEAGCGLGVIAREAARLGARTVYAVEANEPMAEIAAENLAGIANVRLVHGDVRDFVPSEPVELLVHDFFGPMLYDEDLYVLQALRFAARRVLPDRARLGYGWARSAELCDDVVTPSVLSRLRGALVMGLFDDELILPLPRTAAEWSAATGLQIHGGDLSDVERGYDVLYFGLEIFDGDRRIGSSGGGSNWSYVFTPRAGDRFRIGFEHNGRSMEALFDWIAE